MCWCLFFKQKTAYDLRISDWSSDVCSSDLIIKGILNIGSHAVVGGEAEWHRAQILRRIGGDDNVELDRETVRKPGRLLELVGRETLQIGRASCRERVCQYV